MVWFYLALAVVVNGVLPLLADWHIRHRLEDAETWGLLDRRRRCGRAWWR